MKIGVPRERREHERRVAATPDTVKKLIALGFDVVVERDAGADAAFLDAAYEAAGASLGDDAATTLADADIVLKVQRPLTEAEGGPDELSYLKAGAKLIGLLSPYADPGLVQAYADAKVDAFAMELLPRITRAQGMDVLSSQSNLAGYRAVLEAANIFGRAMPMMMTAAGTVAPARVVVMGAGVAGLQAIATARRLGAIVSAFDVRPAVKEQVESLGAIFIEVVSEETDEAETAGGYAKEMSEDYKRKQSELVHGTVKKQDIVITTALIPGKAAPILITEAMVLDMKPGSVILDMAIEAGGNCELSEEGIVEVGGVTIVAYPNLPSRIAESASSLYARNLLNFLTPLIDEETKLLKLDPEDEIIQGTQLTRDGEKIHPAFLDTGD
ncbi:Re/Si-specific NAD(P)(+) transhydrogenase subunit alpha [Rhodospirillaceae bacterium AH-315-P19]|nr:Re/Si-specific NAD(P)(+) transhydrogenase subunit alpha [Rhodospirillaceae bacterium AH-315-P19]